MTITLRIAENTDAAEWNSVVVRSPHGTIFHQWEWLKIVEEHTDSRLIPLFGVRGEETIGIFPLFYRKIGPARMVFSPPPNTSVFYLGPALLDLSGKQERKESNYFEFQREADRFITDSTGSNYRYISLSPDLQDPRPFLWSGYEFESHFDYAIDLRYGYDSLFQTLNAKVRQNINRSIRRGMTVETGGRDEYEIILDLMDTRYTEQGKTVNLSRDYFPDIFDRFRDNLKIFVVKSGGEVITGSIDLQFKNIHNSWIGSPKPQIPISPSPNDILLCESVRHACEQGFRYYNTMNAAGNERLHSFYASKFNPALKAHFSFKQRSLTMKLMEKAYLGITKPYRERIRTSLNLHSQ